MDFIPSKSRPGLLYKPSQKDLMDTWLLLNNNPGSSIRSLLEKSSTWMTLERLRAALQHLERVSKEAHEDSSHLWWPGMPARQGKAKAQDLAPVFMEESSASNDFLLPTYREVYQNADSILDVEAVTPEPEAVTPEPEAVTPEPEAVTPEPEAVTPEPEAVTPEPEAVTPEPEAVTPEPEAVTPEPMSTFRAKVLHYLDTMPPAAATWIAWELKENPADVRDLLKVLQLNGLAKSSGRTRGTRWTR